MKQSKTLASHALIFSSLLLSACATDAVDRFDEINVHTWDIKASADYFPEVDDPRVNIAWLKKDERPSFGIAFSGGGTRSAAATLGQLRALKKLGWMDKARYVTANSGGSWTLVPFIYLPQTIDDQTFLGRYTPPDEINDMVLGQATEAGKAMSAVIYHASIGNKLASLRRGDESYADVIGKIFLQPFGLHDRSKLFTFDNKALESALNANPNLTADDFYVVEKPRPYPIIVGTMRVPLEEKEGQDEHASELFPVEATPLYIGIRNEFSVPTEKKARSKVLVGGGYVESYGYDSNEPMDASGQPTAVKSKDGLWTVRLRSNSRTKNFLTGNKRYRFTLSDVMAMSGAAPAITMADKGLHAEIFPEFRHWAIDREKVLKDEDLRNEDTEFKHGDGGDLDNLALIPLLVRKIENIMVFINARVPFADNAHCEHISTDIMVDDVISLFRPIGKYENNVVIDDENGQKLKTLCREFSKLKALKAQPASNTSLVYCDTYDIKNNQRHAVRGEGYQLTICWVYLNRAQQWIDKLNIDGGKYTQDLKNGRGDFDHFPHYQTFNEKKNKLINLNPERVHALANLAAWTVLENQDYLAEKLKLK